MPATAQRLLPRLPSSSDRVSRTMLRESAPRPPWIQNLQCCSRHRTQKVRMRSVCLHRLVPQGRHQLSSLPPKDLLRPQATRASTCKAWPSCSSLASPRVSSTAHQCSLPPPRRTCRSPRCRSRRDVCVVARALWLWFAPPQHSTQIHAFTSLPVTNRSWVVRAHEKAIAPIRCMRLLLHRLLLPALVGNKRTSASPEAATSTETSPQNPSRADQTCGRWAHASRPLAASLPLLSSEFFSISLNCARCNDSVRG